MRIKLWRFPHGRVRAPCTPARIGQRGAKAKSRLEKRLSQDLHGRARIHHASAHITRRLNDACAYLARARRFANMIFFKKSRDLGVEAVKDPTLGETPWQEKLKKTKGTRVRDTFSSFLLDLDIFLFFGEKRELVTFFGRRRGRFQASLGFILI